MSFYFVTLVSAFFINGMLYTTNTKIFHHLTIKHWNSIFAVVSSIFQGGVCGLAGKFPSGYVNAVISGQALGDRQHMSIFFFFFSKKLIFKKYIYSRWYICRTRQYNIYRPWSIADSECLHILFGSWRDSRFIVLFVHGPVIDSELILLLYRS
jgi:hypothetical protein